jgi:crossover junction endodeoxyribonuclease RuvC
LKILGIDPGTKNMGYATIELENRELRLLEAGVVKFRAESFKEKIEELNSALDTILSNRVDHIAIENIFLAYNPKTALRLAHFRGAILMKVILSIGDYSEYSPLEVKRAITGNGKATKEQVSFMVKRILNIRGNIKPYDITDAMAIAITHSQRLRSNM